MSTTRRAFLQHSTAALATVPGLAVVPGLAAVPRLARAAEPSGGTGAGAPAAVTDVHRPLPPGGVRLGGLLGQRLDDCIRNGIGAQDVAALVAPFRLRDETWSWRTEFWGKWFTSAAGAWRYGQDPALRATLLEAVRGLLATQTPDGYIGTYVEDARLTNWDVWGRKYVLLGLLSWHELTGDAAALAAAARSADYLLESLGPGKARSINETGRWNGLASGSILEPVVLLHRATGEKRYGDFARWIVAQWAEYDGPRLVDQALQGVPVLEMFSKPLPAPKSYAHYGQSKAYEMMSCYEGLAELHRQTGDAAFRAAVESVVRTILETEITIVGSGSCAERWCGGALRQHEDLPAWMETCVTATWIKLLAQVHRLSGNPLYVDEIERAAHNALLGALGRDGSWWAHYSPLAGARSAAPEQCSMRQNCCVASGPRALALLPQLAVMQGAEGPVLNLYGPLSARAASPSGAGVALKVETDYPAGGTIAVTVTPDRSETFALRLRVPAWSAATDLRVNGEAQAAEPGTYAVVRRRWAPGDTVTLTLDLRARAVPMPGERPFTAVVRGPVVLAFDRRITRDLEGEGWDGLRLRAGPDGTVDVRPATAAGGLRMAFDVPFRSASGREATLRMGDYASAGETWSAASKLRVWLPHGLDGRDLFAGVPDAPPDV